jgi:hypothetical protein
MLFFSEAALRRAICEYIEHYNWVPHCTSRVCVSFEESCLVGRRHCTPVAAIADALDDRAA